MVISILFSILCLICPLLTTLAYRQGIKDGRAINQGAPLTPVIHTSKSAQDSRTPQGVKTIEEINYDISLQNMLDYDGTAESQKELIKEGEH